MTANPAHTAESAVKNSDALRVCRVLPDLPAVERGFDYLVPDAWAGVVGVGSIVRVALRGRRVRGWVIEDAVVPEAPLDRLQPLLKVSSDGPPAELVELSAWAAWRWAGPRVAFLRAASPPNNVTPGTCGQARGPTAPSEREKPADDPADDPDVEALAMRGRELTHGVVRWPPAARWAELLRRLVAPDGSTVVVIPDAVRAEALARHLNRSGRRALLVRGDDPGAVRTAAWVEASAGNCVVVGGRLAAWAPVPDARAFVLVDDADEALKDERAPTWHAREVAAERAARGGARLTVASPAPTVEALQIGVVVAPSRVTERRGWGRLMVVDRREEAPGMGMFSPELTELLRRTVARAAPQSGQQAPSQRALCVLNRKGRARLLRCDACRELVRCEACGAAVGEETRGLVCRVCATERPRVCAHCASTVLRRLRPGVQRVAEEAAALLPRVAVAEIAGAPAPATELPDAPVLVGTEAVLHRAGDAGLVAFLDFDQELLAPRFRAPEEALWLLVRARRAAGSRGVVLVQTHLPDHEVIASAREGDPQVVTEADAARRRQLGLPPFGAMALVEGEAKALAALRVELSAIPGVAFSEVPGTLQGRAKAIVRSPSADHLCDALAAAAPAARAAGRLRIEVDPLRL